MVIEYRFQDGRLPGAVSSNACTVSSLAQARRVPPVLSCMIESWALLFCTPTDRCATDFSTSNCSHAGQGRARVPAPALHGAVGYQHCAAVQLLCPLKHRYLLYDCFTCGAPCIFAIWSSASWHTCNQTEAGLLIIISRFRRPFHLDRCQCPCPCPALMTLSS